MDPFSKHSFVFNISREMAVDEGLVAPTAEEAAARNASAAEWAVKRTEARQAFAVAIAALNALTDVTARAVLDLHDPDETGYQVTCSHCLDGSDDGTHQDWPCETVRVVAKINDVALPAMTVYRVDNHEPYVWQEGVLGPRFEYKPSTAFIDS